MVKIGIDEETYHHSLGYRMLESKDGAGIMTFCKNGEADQITWKDAVRKGHALASYFMANGIEKKKIAIIGGYSSKSYIMFLACVTVGNKVIVLDAAEAGRFEFIGELGCEYIWLDQDTCADSVDFSPYDTVTTLLKVGTLPAKVTLETHSDMSEILMDEVELLDGDINTIRDYLSSNVTGKDVLCYSTTSGTTGRPKIIQFPNRYGADMAYPTYDNDPAGLCDIFKMFSLFGFGGTLKFLKTKTNLGAIGNFVSHFYYVLTIYNCSERIVNMNILDQHNFEHTAEMMVELGVSTCIFYLPRLLDFIGDKSFSKYDLSNTRVLLVIGSMLTREIYDRIETAFMETHGTTPIIVSGYGSTELGSFPLRCGLFDSREARINTVGQVMHQGACRIRNVETGELINDPNIVGEVELFSPFKMIGYVGHEPVVDFWKMGDLGQYDENGYVILVGRIKEQITLRNTKKTNDTTIDLEVQKCGCITEIATISKRNANGYDDVHVFIRCDEQSDTKVLEFCDTTIRNLLVDAPIVHIQRDALPRLVNGKYDKGVLKALISQ